jgi:hypothetical protein
VKRNVSDILQKLKFENRSRIASYVAELESTGLWNLLIDTVRYIDTNSE